MQTLYMNNAYEGRKWIATIVVITKRYTCRVKIIVIIAKMHICVFEGKYISECSLLIFYIFNLKVKIKE